MTRLRDRTCLITGAAGGLGRSLAMDAVGRGARLVLTDLDADGLARTVADVRQAGGTVVYAEPADLTDYESVRVLADAVHAESGAVQVVMNVAGIAVWGSVQRLTHWHWRHTVDVNLMGPIHVIEAFVPRMIEAGHGGHVVNVASAAALFGLPRHAAYSAGKFGLRGVSEVLRYDLRQHRIGVSLVCPGAMDTPMVQRTELVGIDRQARLTQQLMKRFVRHAVSPDDAAKIILDAVERNRYMIYTSRVIQFGHWLQRYFPPAYSLVMRWLNWYWTRFVERRSQIPAD